MRVSAAVLFALTTVAAQGPPPSPQRPTPPGMPRDTVQRPEPAGTGVIRGRVVTADSGNPVRRATVNLQPVATPVPLTPPPPPGAPAATTTRTMASGVSMSTSMSVQMTGGRQRSVTTDAQGTFEFTGLPAGTYRVFANPGQYSGGYLSMSYGARRPTGGGSVDTGTSIELADGQRFDKATIALPRGAVLAGRVSDENGEPLARVQVYTMFYAPGSARAQRQGMSAQTDDLGQFRLYGLSPGEYALVAEARGPTFVAPNAPPESEEDRTGFMTTYYPGTPDEAAAQRVRARAGAETPGLEIRMATGRLFRIAGVITDSQGRSGGRAGGQLYKGGVTGGSSYGFSTDEQGRFQMRNIPPGEYRLIVRGLRVPNGEGQQNDATEMASMPLTVASDLEGLVVMTGPGVAITGQVVFETGPPQVAAGQLPFQLRVTAAPGDPQGTMGMPMPQPAVVTPDFTFTMKNLFGELLLRSSGPGMYLKSVTAGGQDITDTPHQFKNGEQVTIVMATRASMLEGIVSDAAGKPSQDAAILVFSEEKQGWRWNSTRTRRGSVDPTGRYRVSGLLPGRYFVVALPRERLNTPPSNQDAAFFEQLAKEATTFVIGEDEQRQVDLKIATGAGG